MRRTYVVVFLLALISLGTEVLLTRIFDVLLWHNLSFMVISCAVFGLALGGLRDVLAPPASSGIGESGLHRLVLAIAASVWAIPLLLNVIPFSLDEAGRHPIAQLVWFLLLYLVLLAPFFFIGWSVCRIFSLASRQTHRLYGVDLTGAAVGTILLFPLIQPLGPERLLLCASLVAVVAAIVLAPSVRTRAAIAGIGLLLALAPTGLGPTYLTLRLHDDKRETQREVATGRLEVSTWDPISQIDVLDEPPRTSEPGDHGRKHIAYDGGSQTSNFFPFDGNFARLRADLPRELMFQFWQRGVLAAHYLHRNTTGRTLIIGSAGGQETKAALMYGAKDVDAVEMVRTVGRLATGPYAAYIGHLFDRAGVHLRIAEGRTYLRRSHKHYDVIQVFSNYTTSSITDGSGALTPAYLVTTDAFNEYFSHLTPDGILQINHLFYPRIIATAATAWRARGGRDFRSHVAVVQQDDSQPDFLPTILVKMSPWTPAELAELRGFFAFPAVDEPRYRLVEDPLNPAASFLPDAFYSGNIPPMLRAAAPYDLTPVTDDRPFLQMMRRSIHRVHRDRATGVDQATAWAMNTWLYDGWLPKDWLHLIGAGVAGVFYGVLFIILPMLWSRAGRARSRGKRPVLVYFSLLGFAFMTLELEFIQVFTKLIGYPLYALATVLTIMLIGAAMGSLSSARLAGSNARRWPIVFAGLLVAALAMWLAYPTVTAAFLTKALPLRMAAAAALIGPLAFFMGMPFPLGLLELVNEPKGSVAWAWSMNGLCTTIGGVASALLSLWLGFRGAILISIGVYALAAIAFGWLRQTTRAHALTPVPMPTLGPDAGPLSDAPVEA